MASLKSVIASRINNNLENINNCVMTDTDNMKEKINKNVDSNKHIRENGEKDVRSKEKVIRNVSENCKNDPITNFKCNYESDLKFLRKKKTLYEINLILSKQLLGEILKSY